MLPYAPVWIVSARARRYVLNANDFDEDRCVGDDYSRLVAYVSVSVVGEVSKFAVRRCAVPTSRTRPQPPYTHWAVWTWYFITAVQIIVYECLLEGSSQLKPGPPLEICGSPYKEFSFPRFKGNIFFHYFTLFQFGLWTTGNWLRAQQCEPPPATYTAGAESELAAVPKATEKEADNI